MPDLLNKYRDAEMGLADDITDRALDAHMADLEAKNAQQATSSTQEVHKRIESRDTTIFAILLRVSAHYNDKARVDCWCIRLDSPASILEYEAV